MIKVGIRLKDGNITGLKMSGHANSAPYGQDLVCAAASAIAIGGLNALDEMYPQLEIPCQAADNRISVDACACYAEVQPVLQTIYYQLRTLEDQFPKSISILKKEV